MVPSLPGINEGGGGWGEKPDASPNYASQDALVNKGPVDKFRKGCGYIPLSEIHSARWLLFNFTPGFPKLFFDGGAFIHLTLINISSKENNFGNVTLTH